MRLHAAIPPEHGAWALLLGSITIAYAHPTSWTLASVPLALLAVLGYAVQQPVRDWLRGRPHYGWLFAELALLTACAAIALSSEATRVAALRLLGIGGVVGLLDLYARRHGHGRDHWLRILGIAALAWILPELWWLGQPEAIGVALTAWALVVVWFTSRMAYLRMQRARHSTALKLCLVSLLPWWALLTVIGVHLPSPWFLLALAPAPLLARPWLASRSMRQLGMRELAAFGWLVVVVVLTAVAV